MKTLLVLEDEPLVMNLLRYVLKQYSLMEARSAEEALRLFRDRDREIDLLLADLTLPLSSGVRVALSLRSELPALPVILTSGYPANGWNAQDSADLKSLGSDSVIVLEKPNPPKRLVNAIEELIRGAQQPKTATAGPSVVG